MIIDSVAHLAAESGGERGELHHCYDHQDPTIPTGGVFAFQDGSVRSTGSPDSIGSARAPEGCLRITSDPVSSWDCNAGAGCTRCLRSRRLG
jgi:hypothetical protein